MTVQPPRPNAGLRPVRTVLDDGVLTYSLETLEADLFVLARSTSGQVFNIPVIRGTPAQAPRDHVRFYFDPSYVVGGDDRTQMLKVKHRGQELSVPYANLFAKWRWGVRFAAGYAEPGPLVTPGKYYWAQYVKLDANETVPNAYNGAFGPIGATSVKFPGVAAPVDGKWYIDGPATTMGLAAAYPGQSFTIANTLSDSPSFLMAATISSLTYISVARDGEATFVVPTASKVVDAKGMAIWAGLETDRSRPPTSHRSRRTWPAARRATPPPFPRASSRGGTRFSSPGPRQRRTRCRLLQRTRSGTPIR